MIGFTEEQLKSFYGENVDVSTLPSALYSGNVSYFDTFLSILPIIIVFAIIFFITLKIKKNKAKKYYSSLVKQEEKEQKHVHNYYFNVYGNKKPYNNNSKKINYKKHSNNIIDVKPL